MNHKIKFLITLFIFTVVSACGYQPATNNLKSLDPKPSDQLNWRNQLKRFKGQTNFMNARSYAFYPMAAEETADGGIAKSESGERAVQESDIFKIGKKGSKLLYLLNNYRGLQVVSFKAGPANPELLGRVKASGNWPDRMYYLEQSDQIIVLERDGEQSDYYSNDIKSRILIYDVKSPASPKIVATTNLNGRVVDSRIVGDVLYVALSKGYSYFREDREQEGAMGVVKSFSLTEGQINLIHSLELPHRIKDGLMNIKSVKNQNQFSYYLMAVSANNESWWARKNIIQVVDITDPKGQISPVMSVTTKGFIDERSATHIKNNTLIVTSNYRTGEGSWQDPLRIAVEGFRLPTQNSTVISETEAKELSSEELKGKFVKVDAESGNSFLQKMTPDTIVTVGNDESLHARIQDIRYVDNLLYVFWVPQNQIDPFDLFDISNPAEDIKFLGRLKFNGFIQRSIPLTYEQENYVLALGWIRPIVDNEENRRYPQVMLFKVAKDSQGNYSHQTISTMTLQDQSAWANFNGEDKFVEMRMTGKGKGTLLFPLSKYENGNYQSGGKIVGFDLAKDQVFTEGGLLKAETGWLRRVFNNPELGLINTFTDQVLTTYDANLEAGEAHEIHHAISTLELARNIKSYLRLSNGREQMGIQIIDDNPSWSYWQRAGNKELTSKLRLVEKNKADSELTEIVSQFKVTGAYHGHSLQADGQELYLLTKGGVQQLDGQRKNDYYLYLVRLSHNGRSLFINQIGKWQDKWSYQSPHFYLLRDGRLILNLNHGKLYKVDPIKVEELRWSTFQVTDHYQNKSSLKLFDGNLYYTYTEQVENPLSSGQLELYKSFVAPIKITGREVTTLDAINIPGTLIGVKENGKHFVTLDQHVLDFAFRANSYYHEVSQEQQLTSLKVNDDQAELKDVLLWEQGGEGQLKWMKRPGKGDLLITIDQKISQPDYGYEMYSVSPYFPRPIDSNGEVKLSYITFDEDKDFTKSTYVLPFQIKQSLSLQSIFGKKTSSLALLKEGNIHRVIEIFPNAERPVMKKIVESDEETNESVSIPTTLYYYGNDSAEQPYFVKEENKFHFATGLYGVETLQVTF